MGVEDWVYFDVERERDRELIEGVRDTLTYLLACKLEGGRTKAVSKEETAAVRGVRSETGSASRDRRLSLSGLVSRV